MSFPRELTLILVATSFIMSTTCAILPFNSIDCCPSLPPIINDKVVNSCVSKMSSLDKKNNIQRPSTAPPGGLCLLECFVNETGLAVKGNVTLNSVQTSLYSLFNATTIRNWKPIIDKYVPICITDYQNFNKSSSELKNGDKGNQTSCCPSSGYLVARLMGELFIHCPDFSNLPRCNVFADQVKQTGLYVVAQDLSSFT